jgi:putative heme transporter
MGEVPRRRSKRPRSAAFRHVLRVLVAAVIVGGVFVGVLPQLADLDAAWDALVSLPIGEIAALAGLAVGVLLATWVALARLIEGATLVQAGIAHVLSTAVANTVPAGGAVAIGVNLRVHGSYGRTIGQTTTGLLTMGVLDNAVKLGLPVVIVALSPFVPGAEQLPRSAALGALAFAVVAVVAAVSLGREPVVRRIAGWAQGLAARRGRTGETDWADAAVAYLRGLLRTLRRHGPSAFLAVALSHVLQIVLLLVALRALGVPAEHAGTVRVTVVYMLVRLVTALPVTPGGLGVAELGLVAGLRVGVPAGFEDAILAATLLFRVGTYLLPVVLAAPTWVLWRWNRPAVPPVGEGRPTSAPPPVT